MAAGTLEVKVEALGNDLIAKINNFAKDMVVAKDLGQLTDDVIAEKIVGLTEMISGSLVEMHKAGVPLDESLTKFLKEEFTQAFQTFDHYGHTEIIDRSVDEIIKGTVRTIFQEINAQILVDGDTNFVKADPEKFQDNVEEMLAKFSTAYSRAAILIESLDLTDNAFSVTDFYTKPDVETGKSQVDLLLGVYENMAADFAEKGGVITIEMINSFKGHISAGFNIGDPKGLVPEETKAFLADALRVNIDTISYRVNRENGHLPFEVKEEGPVPTEGVAGTQTARTTEEMLRGVGASR